MNLLEMKGISKWYTASGVLANNAVDLTVRENEIHALIGENGAGKSTLMKILYGLEPADSGEISLRGKTLRIRDPHQAIRAGIGMVQQHVNLVPDFTVAENVVLGDEPRKRGLFLDRRTAVRAVSQLIEEHGLGVDAAQRAGTLTVGQMQQVELLKMLYRHADLLVLDEPTSVLTEQQVDRFFDAITHLLSRGKTILLITHKLDEVMRIAHRATVMRRGQVVAVTDIHEVDEQELSRLMLGRNELREVERAPVSPGDPVLEMQGASIHRRGQDRPLLDRINLFVRAGEIVAITGVSGNGLAEIEDTLGGLRRLHEGRLILAGEDVTSLGVEGLRSSGLAYVPADRLHRGACLPVSVRDNCIVTHHHSFLRAGVLKQGDARAFTRKLIDRFSISAREKMPVASLSGGNIQRMILAREMEGCPRLVLLSEPTWGLDIAGRRFVHQTMLEMRGRRIGVLLISSDADEVLALADRIYVLHRGRIVAHLENTAAVDKAILGEYMLGLRHDTQDPAPTNPAGAHRE